jgi:ubiquinone/menaquinone biosynthesis C-methylase UbiE
MMPGQPEKEKLKAPALSLRRDTRRQRVTGPDILARFPRTQVKRQLRGERGKMAEVFDDWPEKYDQWFETPIGRLVRECESRLLLETARPARGERILDAGCGTGIFTLDLLAAGARVTGLELSLPMLRRAGKKATNLPFSMVQGDMRGLPFADRSFDTTVSVTAIEFVEDARAAVAELFRVTRPGGWIVVACLNSLSPWAARRKAAAAEGHSIFRHARFRSPEEMAVLASVPALIRTAVHFQKRDDPERAKGIEREGEAQGLDTGAFLVARWEKPAVKP